MLESLDHRFWFVVDNQCADHVTHGITERDACREDEFVMLIWMLRTLAYCPQCGFFHFLRMRLYE